MRSGAFEIDAAAGELRKNNERVRLQDLPFRVLVFLVRRAGKAVTRDELRAEVWGASTFVDAEAGLNTAIAKLREALGDDANAPVFIETLPKRGYRWIGGVDGPAIAEAESQPARSIFRSSASRIGALSVRWVLGVVAIVAVASGAWQWLATPAAVTIAVVLFHNETGDSAMDQLAQQLTDATVVALAQDARYHVIGNASILRTPRIFADIQKIGETLDADYLVIGQLQSAGAGPVVRAHFVRVSDQKHLWAREIAGSPVQLDQLVPGAIAAGLDGALKPAKPD